MIPGMYIRHEEPGYEGRDICISTYKIMARCEKDAKFV
jgi:hypothetical protein